MGRSKNKGGLGFGEVEALAKQLWRLIQQPESLSTCVIRVKYCPDGNLLECQLSRTPSYAWWSIWSSKDSLEARMVWRVGNGQSLRVWEDKWI